MYGPQTKMSEEFHEIQPNYRKSTFPIDLVTMFFCFNPPICVVQKCVQHHVFHESQPKHGPLLLKSPKNHYPLRWWSRTSSAPSLVKVPPTLQGASLWPSHDGKMGGATTCTWDAMDGNHPKIGREVMQTCGKCQEMRGRNALNFTELMFLRQKKVSKWGISQFSRRSSMFMAFRHSWNNCSSIMGLFRGAQVWDTKWCLFVQLVWPCLNHQPLSLFCCEQSSNKWEDAK